MDIGTVQYWNVSRLLVAIFEKPNLDRRLNIWPFDVMNIILLNLTLNSLIKFEFIPHTKLVKSCAIVFQEQDDPIVAQLVYNCVVIL